MVSVWDFGDGTTATNRIAVSHAWSSSGTYPVVFTAYNNSHPAGVSVTTLVQVLANPVHYVSSDSITPVAPYLSWATAATNVQAAIDASFAGGTVLVTNGTYQTGGRVVSGSLTNRVAVTRPLTVQSVNGPAVTAILGYQVPGTTNDEGAVRCVYLTTNTLLCGFTLSNGATRAAGDTALEQSGGGAFCADSSAVISNCVLTANAAAYGGGAACQGTFYNCAFFGNWALNEGVEILTGGGGAVLQASLNNCLLSNNWVVANNGGGASFCVLSNCTLTANSAYYAGGADNCTLYNSLLTGNQGAYGGAALGGSLFNCIIQSNSASQWGGGAYSSTLNNCLLTANSAGTGGGAISCQLNNCTVAGNSATTGGGVNSSTVNNCIIYYNSAPSGSNYASSGLSYCCTAPDPGPTSNITNAPLFVDPTHGNFRLQAYSPCINSGRNALVAGSTDLDGGPRIVGGTADIGAYEFPSPVSMISYAWLLQYGLPITTNTDRSDPDGDGMNNYQEWIAGTNPTNALSVLAMVPPAPTNNPAGLVVTWQSVSNIVYFLQSSTNLGGQPEFSTIQSNILGQSGTTSYTDPTATNTGPYFYRVGVQQ
jgi:hypothetical protein